MRGRMKDVTAGADGLLQQMAAGDQRAFQQLYESHAKWIYAISYRILREPQAAEDATQEAFVKLWRNASRFDPARGSGKSWIGIIARNSALDLIRRRQPADELDDAVMATMATDAVDPPDPKLGKCLGQLPPDQARAIVTMYSYGLSHSELSEQFDLPLGTIKSWVRRGTQALRQCMEQ